MNEERWQKLQDVLAAAWMLAPGERAAYLDEHCENPDLRAQARALLVADEEAEGYFDRLAGAAGVTRNEEPAPADLSGRRVDRYRLLEPLGRGGMGVVYLAERADGAFEQRVAVKLLAMGVAGAHGHRRFVAERQILASLEHPAIARVLDGGITEDGTPYFVMERVEGERIDAWCDARRLGLRERVELVARVCDAVEYAHRNLIVHRDLKPANILVTGEGDPKLLDFGVAKLLSAADPDLTRSRAAAPLTPAWAAPEQLEGGAITTATDTHALGALAYLLLTGVPPHDLESRTRGGVLRRLRSEPVAPSRRFASLPEAEQSRVAAAHGTTPGELRRRLAGDLDAILLRALAPAPERRYGSAGGLAADLRAYLRGWPVTARPPSPGYRLGRFVSRHRVAVAAVAVIVAVGIAGLVGTLWQARQAVHEAQRAGAALDYVRGLLEALVPRAGEPVADRSVLLAHAAEDARTALREEPLALADVHATIATLFARIGRYPQALKLREEVLALQRAHRGELHPETAAALGAWAETRAQMDDSDRATIEVAFTDAIARLARHRNEGSSQAEVRVAYAAYLADHDAMAEAMQQLDAAAAAFASTGDKDARQRLEVAWLASQILLRMDRLDEAERRLAPAIGEARRVLPPDDELLAHLLSARGSVLSRRHHFARAIPLFEEAVTIQRALYPEGNESTLDTLSRYATALMAAGDLPRAIRVRERHLALSRSLFAGPSHQLALALSGLGTVYFRQGEFARAAELQAEAAAVFEEVYGPAHAGVAISRGNLAEALYELNELERAKIERTEALSRICAIFGEISSRCADQHSGMGRIELGLDRITSAESHFRAALVGTRQTLGDRHPTVAVTRAWLAESLRRQGRFDEATVQMDAAATGVPVDRPELHGHFMVIADLHARLICEIGEPEECAELVRTADAALARRYPAGHPRRRELARLASAAGVDSVLGDDHPAEANAPPGT